MAFKKVRVTLHHIKNEKTGSDPGDELEFYGSFDVARLHFDPGIGQVLSLDQQNLFFRPPDDTVDVPQGQQFPVNTSAVVTIRDGEFLQISGHLTEQDTLGSDDRMGSVDFRKRLDQITDGPLEDPAGIHFAESDQHARVLMSTFVEGQG